MPRSDRDTDDMIREALAEADEEILEASGARSMAELLAEVFRGRNRRLAIGGAIVNLALLVAAITSGVRFVRADDARATALWGIAMLLAFGALMAIKVWYWLEMHRLALMRDLKRVELRVAQIADRLERGADPARD